MDPIPPQFLVSIFGPGNVLAAVSALRFLTRGDAAVEVTTVLHLPGWSRGEMADMRKVVDDLLVSFDLPPSIAFGQEDIDGFLASSGNVIDEQAIARVRTALGDRRFAKVFYAHNIVGQATDLFLRAYPEAESITFGDALGSVYNKEFHLALATGQSWPFGRVARPDFKPDRALLILPMDQTGDCLDGSDLEVVPLEFVGGLIGQASPRLTELEAIATALSDYGDSPVAILLLENMSDGAFISLEQEVELYREIIRRHIPNDSIVVLKGHPLAKRDVASLLAARLHPTHRSIVIPPNLARYPIEFWGEILRRSSVIGFSYSCVSLRALFGKEVLNPMTEEMLTKYFSASIRPSYRNALMLLQEQQRSLEEWDGKGILWSGRYPERAGDGPSLSGVATSDSTEALLSRGKESGRLGQMEDARRWFEQALANAPEDATILNNLAISFASEGVLDIAFEAVSRAHRLIPGEQTILSNLVALANQLGRHDIVRAVGQLIVSLDPGEVNRRNLSRLQGSWLVHQSRVRVGQNVIFGGGSFLEVVSSRSGGSGCVSIGSDSQIFGTFVLAGPDARIQIGARTQIGSSRLVARESICIGDDVLMAWGVTILDHDAWAYSWTERRAQMEGFRKEMSQMPSGNSPHFAALSAVSSPVRIGDRAWIGFNVIVGKGVSIGEGAVIGAGSVVYEDVPPYSVVAGNPGRVVKLLKPSTISRVGNDAFPSEERPSS